MPDLDDEEEFTELLGAQFSRVDLVQAPANGATSFLVMKQDDAAGLLDPEFVRTLIGKQAEPDPEPGGMVTMTATPAAMAEMLARVRKGTQDEDVAKAKNDTADRKHKAATGAAMPDGSYPIADVGDLEKAIHAVGRGGASHGAIRKHIISRARSLGASSKIPDNWNSDGSLKESVSKEDAVTGAVAKADMGPELDDGVDQLDPTVPLCAPDEDRPGDPTDPGSPAWEAIDAATASKWLSIASRFKNALCVMADREFLEAAGADPDDAENAWDLQDAQCAMDFVISVLAVFAATEQAEADLGAEEMAAIGKAAAGDAAPVLAAIRKAMSTEGLGEALVTVEAYPAIVRKAGRVLSAVNEAHLREAHARLNTVLSSLPSAPATDDGQQVAKGGVPVTATQTDAQVAKDAAEPIAKEDAEGRAITFSGGALDGDALLAAVRKAVFEQAEPGDWQQVGLGLSRVTVVKDDGDAKKAMTAVFNADGKLIGIVDPDDITPVSNSEASTDGTEDAGAEAAAAAPAPDASDMTPQPPAEAGTPADDVAKAAPAAPAEQDPDTRTVLKSIVSEALAEILTPQGTAEGVAKQADVAALSGTLQDVLARLETVEKQDARPGVFTHGAVPPPGSEPPPRPSLRGQDQGAAQPVDVAKALELKHRMYTADPAEAKQIQDDLNQMAIDGIAALHRR